MIHLHLFKFQGRVQQTTVKINNQTVSVNAASSEAL